MPSNFRIAIFYPYTGLPSMDRGSARRLVPLVEVLAEEFASVTILSPGDAATQKNGNIEYRFHQPTPGEKKLTDLAFRLFDGLTYHAWRSRVDIRERRQWWHYLQPRLQPSLHDQISRLARESDAIVLEYPFWAALMPAGKPVVMTLNDVLSELVTQPRLKRIVERCELAAYRRASAIVTVTPEDRDKVRAAGFESVLVPHSFPIRDQTEPLNAPEDPGVAGIAARRQRGEMVCLFVGSSLQPNRDAVEFIQGVAAQSEPGLFFAIAGSCCGKMELGPNIASLGPVSESDLDHLYAACEVVLAPLFAGTGSSLKVLEAFSKRKVLLCTPIGARGYEIVPDREAIVIEDQPAFAAALARLRQDPAERARLAAHGRAFVEAFDSRRVYQAYVQTIQRFLA